VGVRSNGAEVDQVVDAATSANAATMAQVAGVHVTGVYDEHGNPHSIPPPPPHQQPPIVGSVPRSQPSGSTSVFWGLVLFFVVLPIGACMACSACGVGACGTLGTIGTLAPRTSKVSQKLMPDDPACSAVWRVLKFGMPRDCASAPYEGGHVVSIANLASYYVREDYVCWVNGNASSFSRPGTQQCGTWIDNSMVTTALARDGK